MKSANAALAYIALGSNLPVREVHLKNATNALHAMQGVTPLRVSSVYESEPWGKHDQDNFLNAVVECSITLDAPELLEGLKYIEEDLGRVRVERYGPRTIDLDIILLGDSIHNSLELILPHSRMHQRRFVLVPMVELSPDLKHPVLGSSMNDLLAICPDMGRIWKYEFELRTSAAGSP
jgi:2-amino-4-hydroxy-6-hydroxymethyldihydropteridine diphosphokinase